jgi:hypothetical protein
MDVGGLMSDLRNERIRISLYLLQLSTCCRFFDILHSCHILHSVLYYLCFVFSNIEFKII